MASNSSLRRHVLTLLTARQAHCTFEEAVAEMPLDKRGKRPEELPYSVWELVEHVRFAQRDILDYCRDSEYKAPDWPDAYWPDSKGPSSPEAWHRAISGVEEDRDALCDLIRSERLDLYDTVPSSDDNTFLRECLLVADHNAYHIGQIVTVRRQLGVWPPGSDSK